MKRRSKATGPKPLLRERTWYVEVMRAFRAAIARGPTFGDTRQMRRLFARQRAKHSHPDLPALLESRP